MLVIISDLHITDGSTSTNISGTAFTDILFEEIKSKVQTKNISKVNLVLLGDIFDLVRTEYWIKDEFSNDDKPWYGILDENLLNSKPSSIQGYSSAIEYHYNEVLKSILETKCAKDLKKMILNCSNIYNKESQKITFEVNYIIGNHDRALNNYDSLKKQIELFFEGISIYFKNVLDEEINYKTIARHGHEHDADNHAFEYYKKFIYPEKLKQWEDGIIKSEPINSKYNPEVYKIQTIGEAITAELMSGIVYDAKKYITDDASLLDKVYEINNVRPLEAALDWLVQLSTEKQISQKNKNVLAKSFSNRLYSLLDSSLANEWDNIIVNSFFNRDMVDSLQLVKTLTSGDSLSGIRSKVKLVDAIGNVIGLFKSAIGIKEKDDLEEGAKADFEINPKYQYILYGHTHVERQVNFTATPKNQLHLYINTGTYLPLIQQSKSDSTFYSLNQLSITFVYMNEEDIGNKEENNNEEIQGSDKTDTLPTIDIWIGKKHKNYKRVQTKK